MLKAASVGLAVMILTMVASFPMVAAYAYLIEPGHPREFYSAAAMWIAPWSSHLLGPVLFLWFNFALARRRPDRNAIAFATATIVLYALIDAGSLPLFGASISAFFSPVVLASLAFKTAGALSGAWLGARPAQR